MTSSNDYCVLAKDEPPTRRSNISLGDGIRFIEHLIRALIPRRFIDGTETGAIVPAFACVLPVLSRNHDWYSSTSQCWTNANQVSRHLLLHAQFRIRFIVNTGHGHHWLALFDYSRRQLLAARWRIVLNFRFEFDPQQDHSRHPGGGAERRIDLFDRRSFAPGIAAVRRQAGRDPGHRRSDGDDDCRRCRQRGSQANRRDAQCDLADSRADLCLGAQCGRAHVVSARHRCRRAQTRP